MLCVCFVGLFDSLATLARSESFDSLWKYFSWFTMSEHFAQRNANRMVPRAGIEPATPGL